MVCYEVSPFSLLTFSYSHPNQSFVQQPGQCGSDGVPLESGFILNL